MAVTLGVFTGLGIALGVGMGSRVKDLYSNHLGNPDRVPGIKKTKTLIRNILYSGLFLLAALVLAGASFGIFFAEGATIGIFETAVIAGVVGVMTGFSAIAWTVSEDSYNQSTENYMHTESVEYNINPLNVQQKN